MSLAYVYTSSMFFTFIHTKQQEKFWPLLTVSASMPRDLDKISPTNAFKR